MYALCMGPIVKKMENIHDLRRMEETGQVPPETLDAIRTWEARRPLSLHWELRTLLYAGVLLLQAGLGALAYQHLDTFGHHLLLGLIGVGMLGCFAYCFWQRVPFSTQLIPSPTAFFDYVLLLGCLLFIVLEGYLQYRYTLFGTRYGLATFIPTVLFFFLAYRFDHRGVLGLAITGLAAWLGITVTPKSLWDTGTFSNETLVVVGTGLGVFLTAVAFFLARLDVKRHFSATYLYWGVTFVCVSALWALFNFEHPWAWMGVLLAGTVFFGWLGRRTNDFPLWLLALAYGYIGISFFLFRYVFTSPSVYAILSYFVLSAGGLIYYIVQQRRVI